MSFASENELRNTMICNGYFNNFVEKDNELIISLETKGLFGIPDVLIVKTKDNKYSKKEAIAFELKLKNWNRALVQAFKYRAFADLSYVVLDEKHANPAKNNINRFVKANIGLLTIDKKGHIRTLYNPSPEKPYSDNFESSIVTKAKSNSLKYQIIKDHEDINYNELLIK